MKKTPLNIKQEDREQIARYYNEGMKAKDIAPLYNLTEMQIFSVLQWLRKRGYSVARHNQRTHTRKFWHRSQAEKDEIVREYIQGVSTAKLSRKWKISKTAIYALIDSERKAGKVIPRRYANGNGIFPYKRKEATGYKQEEKKETVEAPKKMTVSVDVKVDVMDVTLGTWIKSKAIQALIKLLQ